MTFSKLPDWTNGVPTTTITPDNLPATTTIDLPPATTDYGANYRHGDGLDQLAPQQAPGLPQDLVRSMSAAADGYEANVELLAESANRVLHDVADPAALAQHFDTLSPSIRAKALRTLWRNPGIGLYDLVDKVEKLLTLEESVQATAWSTKWARMARR